MEDGRPRPASIETILFRFEYRRALFNVRRQAFLRVFALEKQLLIFAFHSQRGFHGNFPARLHRTLNATHGLGGFVRRTELASVFHDVFHESVALENVVDDPKFFGFFERKSVARDHQLNRLALSYHPGKPLRTAGSREYAQIYLWQT